MKSDTRAPGAALGWVLARRSVIRTGPLALIRHRNLDGMLCTMRSSGSHYLQWMLCMAMCEGLGLPHPKHLNDPVLVGFIHDKPPRRDVPRLIRTHTEMPVPLYRLLRKSLRFPKYVVLVRDIRETVVSYFEKDPPRSRKSSFSEYLRGRDTFLTDHVLFRQIRFQNSWARVRRLDPDRVIVVRYDELRAGPAQELARVWAFFGFPETPAETFDKAVALSTKERMAQFEDGRERRVVRSDKRHPFLWFNDNDRAYFEAAVQRYLIDAYGYDYTDWTMPEGAGASAAQASAPEAEMQAR